MEMFVIFMHLNSNKFMLDFFIRGGGIVNTDISGGEI